MVLYGNSMKIELLTEVLGYEVRQYQHANNPEGMSCIYIMNDDKTVRSIQNIYELMHKMKVWAAKQNFKVFSELSHGITRGRARLEHNQEMGFNIFGYQCQHAYRSDWFDSYSEPDSVAIACEWILEYLKENHEKDYSKKCNKKGRI